MPSHQRRYFWRPYIRRLTGGVALLSYVTSALGLPLPSPIKKDRSVPFPCQDRACGCTSAEQSSHSCCCFTPEERRAWAERHGVTPTGCCGGGASEKGECRGCSQACQGCEQEAGVDEKPCCVPNGKSVRWSSGLSALRCKGQGTLWVTTGAVLPPPPPLTWCPSMPCTGWLAYPDIGVVTIAATPPDPPPRLACA
jgi:hypothetical protein